MTIVSRPSIVTNGVFGLDGSTPAAYDQFHITYGEAIQHMANALKMTLYGSLEGGNAVPLTDEELIAFVNRQDFSPAISLFSPATKAGSMC